MYIDNYTSLTIESTIKRKLMEPFVTIKSPNIKNKRLALFCSKYYFSKTNNNAEEIWNQKTNAKNDKTNFSITVTLVQNVKCISY